MVSQNVQLWHALHWEICQNLTCDSACQSAQPQVPQGCPTEADSPDIPRHMRLQGARVQKQERQGHSSWYAGHAVIFYLGEALWPSSGYIFRTMASSQND
eukprot:360838-Chlamydomonas_euryale.AAC.10